MALEVIGAGLGRTGTMTMKTALEALGFGPCHHMIEVFANPDQRQFWQRAAMGEAVDWEEVYAGYRATVDWPSAPFYAELAQRYPEAKMILTWRDPERWYESISQTILESMRQMGIAQPEPLHDHPMRFGQILICERAFGFDFSRENVLAVYNRHVEQVRRTIPAERLLVFEPSDGWEPLCAHLDVPVPPTPFPRTNSREEFWELARRAEQAAQDAA